MHVVANLKFALKSQEAGVDAVVAEGFEAGGHNGREETTTLVLIPQIAKELEIPLIAAGGISSGSAMLASMALGAHGVQIGSRFVTSTECSAHQNFKEKIIEAKEGDTKLQLKQLVSVRLLDNTFSQRITEMQYSGATVEELSIELGNGRSRLGMFEGDLDEGELEIGQVSSMIDSIMPVEDIMDEIIAEYQHQLNRINQE